MCLNDKTINESRDAEFFEHVFPLKQSLSTPSISKRMHDPENPSIVSETPISETVNTSNLRCELELRRSKRQRTEKSFGPDFLSTFIVERRDEIDCNFTNLYLIDEDPKTYQETLNFVESSMWKEAIKSELDSLVMNHTWDLVDLPMGNNPIRCKWIFKRKTKSNGSIERYKTILVVVGYTQKQGIDYFDTYSPITKITTIRALIALAAIHSLIIHQMDVKTAFLNGDLEEEFYMTQPEGFKISGQENKVCKLRKSLYDLKQAPKQWYEKFNNTLINNGFKINSSYTCVYSKVFGADCILICLYVDDMLIFGNMKLITDTKLFLSSHFEMEDLGETDVILGVKIRKNKTNMSLCQSHYVEKILKKFDSFDVSPVRTPFNAIKHLKKNKGDNVSQLEYAKIIGSVMYLMNYTRPDIAYAVSRLSRYTHNPDRYHWDALRHLLRYLKGTIDYYLHFNKFPVVLEGYCDANRVTDNDEVNSTSGYIFLLGGRAISWKSAKQTCIARSTMESEFIALEFAGQEAEWIKNLLGDVSLWGTSVPFLPFLFFLLYFFFFLFFSSFFSFVLPFLFLFLYFSSVYFFSLFFASHFFSPSLNLFQKKKNNDDK
ncbi:hypothetical protein IC582_026232 [Cucumis melo]